MQLFASGEHGIPVAAAAMFQQRPARDEDAIRQSERKIGGLEEQVCITFANQASSEPVRAM